MVDGRKEHQKYAQYWRSIVVELLLQLWGIETPIVMVYVMHCFAPLNVCLLVRAALIIHYLSK